MYGFHDCQIMSGTQKLGQNNTPEPFNRILEAIFDPWQGFKKFFFKIIPILNVTLKFFVTWYFFQYLSLEKPSNWLLVDKKK